MKKGIIATLVVTICMMLTATYAFAASSKAEKKEVKKEATTTEKHKETTKATKPKTKTKKQEASDTEETEISTKEEKNMKDTEDVSDDQKEVDNSESEDLDSEDEEIDDEEIDHCDHVWSEKSVAYDPEEGYVWVQECTKCNLVKQTQATEEDYDAAQQEESEDEVAR